MSDTTDLTPTPGQTVGPFFRFGVEYANENLVVHPHSPGSVLLSGTVFDGEGEVEHEAGGLLERDDVEGGGAGEPVALEDVGEVQVVVPDGVRRVAVVGQVRVGSGQVRHYGVTAPPRDRSGCRSSGCPPEPSRRA